MKGKQSVNELKYRLNIVTSSLFDGRNIKCHLAFTVCNALPSCCATYEQKTWKEMNKAEEKEDVREVVISSSSTLLSKKKPCSCTSFHLSSYPYDIYIRCVRRADFLFLLSITVLTSLAIYAAINHHAWGNPIPS
jgi:hypothetical protein